jgi:hypothetical protein
MSQFCQSWVRTPGARVGVIDGGIDVAQIDFAHETVDLHVQEAEVSRAI